MKGNCLANEPLKKEQESCLGLLTMIRDDMAHSSAGDLGVSYHVLPTTTWVDPFSTGDLRRRGALLTKAILERDSNPRYFWINFRAMGPRGLPYDEWTVNLERLKKESTPVRGNVFLEQVVPTMYGPAPRLEKQDLNCI